VGSGAAATLILRGHRLAAGLAALVALATIVLGSQAASLGRNRRGAFAALILDRVYDGCLLAPLAWVSRSTFERVAVLALVGLGASFLASYERARGLGLGYAGAEALSYREIRMALLALGLLTGWVELSLWLFLVLTATASAARAIGVARQTRRGATVGGRA
jgi:phosphatidylglycerophosphate synthase